MDGFCRGCLIKYDEPTELLQYTEKNRRLYIYSTGLQVKRNDPFTFQLCKDCYVNMKMACKFKKQCRNSDKRFRNYLALKEAGETIDFCTFLKNNDDSFTFRFPLLSGNSTPAYQKPRDDDNESTCTSIRNFMTDILRADEIPDTEARIIREVIEEEADVLDDSLDSHWLQDDASIDTDFRLDFSFSPFSTPRSIPNNLCYTPPRLKESFHDNTESNNFLGKNLLDKPKKIEKSVSEIEDLQDNSNRTVNIGHGKYYDESREENHNINVDNDEKTENECTIDKNLEDALKNDYNKEHFLEDILVTPPVHSGASGMSTPTISNILFGEKLELNIENGNATPKVGQCIEKYEDVEGDIDILEEFFNKDTEQFNADIKVDPEEFDMEMIDAATQNDELTLLDNRYDLRDFSCKICDTKYHSARSLRMHFTRYHKINITTQNKKYKPKVKICDYCGKSCYTSQNLINHIKTHMKTKEEHRCKHCSLTFSTESALKMHMTTHIGKAASKPRLNKFVCSICGATCTSSSNLRLHMRRHTKNYSYNCQECGRGFYRKSDLDIHIRSHNGEKPFTCTYCDHKFTRRDSLNKHMKLHTDEKPFKCSYCKSAFIKDSHLRNHLQNSKTCLKLRLHTELQKHEVIPTGESKQTCFYVINSEETNKSSKLAIVNEEPNEKPDSPGVDGKSESLDSTIPLNTPDLAEETVMPNLSSIMERDDINNLPIIFAQPNDMPDISIIDNNDFISLPDIRQ